MQPRRYEHISSSLPPPCICPQLETSGYPADCLLPLFLRFMAKQSKGAKVQFRRFQTAVPAALAVLTALTLTTSPRFQARLSVLSDQPGEKRGGLGAFDLDGDHLPHQC
jgi:hypothetical protein